MTLAISSLIKYFRAGKIAHGLYCCICFFYGFQFFFFYLVRLICQSVCFFVFSAILFPPACLCNILSSGNCLSPPGPIIKIICRRSKLQMPHHSLASFSLPLRPASSIRNTTFTTSPPSSSTSLIAASTVPPVAIRSSMISYFLSRFDRILMHLNGSTVRTPGHNFWKSVSHGSFPFFLTGTNGL